MGSRLETSTEYPIQDKQDIPFIDSHQVDIPIIVLSDYR